MFHTHIEPQAKEIITKIKYTVIIPGLNRDAKIYLSHFCQIIIIIQIKYYLCAESTATRPITDRAQCSYR
jgi:hypothetical protein